MLLSCIWESKRNNHPPPPPAVVHAQIASNKSRCLDVLPVELHDKVMPVYIERYARHNDDCPCLAGLSILLKLAVDMVSNETNLVPVLPATHAVLSSPCCSIGSEYDGGDCCACTCVDTPDFACGATGPFACLDPSAPCVDDDDVTTFPDDTSTNPGYTSSFGCETAFFSDGDCDESNNRKECGASPSETSHLFCCRCMPSTRKSLNCFPLSADFIRCRLDILP